MFVKGNDTRTVTDICMRSGENDCAGYQGPAVQRISFPTEVYQHWLTLVNSGSHEREWDRAMKSGEHRIEAVNEAKE